MGKLFKESKINRYDILLFVLILCTAGGMWGGALKPGRVMSIIFAIPMLLSYWKVKSRLIKEVYIFLLFLIIWSFASILWTPNSFLGVPEWGNMVLRLLLFVELVIFGVLSKNTLGTLVNGWSAAFLITAVIAVWELNTGNHLGITNFVDGDEIINLGGGNVIARQFAQATFYNYNGYVTFICYCLPFLFCLANRWSFGVRKWLALIPIVLVLYIFILNASRAGIVVYIVYAAVFSYYKFHKSNFSVKLTFILLLAGVVLLFAHFWELMSFYLEYRMETGGLSSSRFQIWGCCWQALVDSGFIGCGIGGVMDALTKQHAYVPQPHNFFFEVLLEFGIIVFVWLLVLMWKTFRVGRNSKDVDVKYIRLSSFIAIPFITMIDSGYVQDVGIYVFLGSLLLINLVCKNTVSVKTC